MPPPPLHAALDDQRIHESLMGMARASAGNVRLEGFRLVPWGL
jgi:hypothetical protein